MSLNNTASQSQITYYFKPNRVIAKKQVYNAFWSLGIYLTVLLAFIVFFSSKPGSIVDRLLDEIFVLSIFALFLFISLIRLFFPHKRQIEINQQEIIFRGSFIPKIPPRIAWNEIVHIYKTDHYAQSQTKWWKRISCPLTLIFILKSGEEFTLVVNNHDNDNLFISDHSTLDLITVLELYGKPVYSVESISDTEKKQIKFFYVSAQNLYNTDLGKEVGHIAYGAVILMLVAIFLFFGFPLYTLENPTLPSIFWSVAIGTFLLACWYMRNIDKKSIMMIPAMLLGGAMVFLMIPVTANIPILLGHKSIETFIITEESDTQQIWQSELSPTLTLRLDYQTGMRRFHGLGTSKEFTVYRGPFGLNSTLLEEYKSLRHQ